MSGLSFEEQTKWRRRFQDAIKYGGFDLNKNPIFFDPTMYYSLFEKQHKSEREVFEFDLNALRKSDLVIVNFNVPQSIGTAMELMLANELHIPIIGYNKNDFELHPWLECCCSRICDSFEELVTHVADFYLK
jgi:nucleoside 2-deoxyribosyltransferase